MVKEPFFEGLLTGWPDQEAAQRYRQEAHDRDLAAVAEASAARPVVHVTLSGMPGHFEGTPGQGDVAYVPPSPDSPA